MAVLDSKIQDKINKLEDLSYEKKQAGNLKEGFRLSEEAWSLYPEPKNNWNEAYNSARYVVEDYMEIGDFENAKKWLNRMIDVKNNLHHNDEQLLFYLGKYFFETGNYLEALSKFKEVVDNVGYRYFDDENSKYLDFYKHPEKYSEAMKELDDKIYKLIEELSEEGNEFADEEKYAEAKAKFEEALKLLPIPKTNWEASLWLYASIGDMNFILGNYRECSDNMFDALNCPDALDNPFVHIRLGQALYELGNTERAKEHLLRAYMLDGKDIFEEQDEKYFDFIKSMV